MRKQIDKIKNWKQFVKENLDYEEFEGINEYVFDLYFDVNATNIPQSQYDNVLYRSLIEEFDGFDNTFYLKVKSTIKIVILKNEWVGDKKHSFDYIKTTIKAEIPKYSDLTIEDIESTIKAKLGSFDHRWNISYDEKEKVHIWLKKLEMIN